MRGVFSTGAMGALAPAMQWLDILLPQEKKMRMLNKNLII